MNLNLLPVKGENCQKPWRERHPANSTNVDEAISLWALASDGCLQTILVTPYLRCPE